MLYKVIQVPSRKIGTKIPILVFISIATDIVSFPDLNTHLGKRGSGDNTTCHPTLEGLDHGDVFRLKLHSLNLIMHRKVIVTLRI